MLSKGEYVNFYSNKSENPNYHSMIHAVRIKIRKFSTLKENYLAVFNSHWSNFAVMKPLLFLIDSTDQSDRFCPTVSRLFEFWLNVSFRPWG